MEAITIKQATINDLSTLQRIGRQTFAETFSSTNSEENMANYLEEGFSAEKLVKELISEGSQFYFALLNNEAIGYLKLNTGQSQTELRDETAVEIERIYVLSASWEEGRSVAV